MPKVGERSRRSRTARHGVTGPAFDNDGPEATASGPALRILGNMDFGCPCRGERLKKHATLLAGYTDKSSSLSRHETDSSNQQNYCPCCARQCRWRSHAPWKFSESEGGRCCLYPILYLRGRTTPKQLEWLKPAHLNKRLRACSGAWIISKLKYLPGFTLPAKKLCRLIQHSLTRNRTGLPVKKLCR